MRSSALAFSRGLAAFLAMSLPAAIAQAQPTRGTPVLKTPPAKAGAMPIAAPGAAGLSEKRQPQAAPDGAAAAGKPGAPGAPPPLPATPGTELPGPAFIGGGADPMANVKQGIKEIEFKPKPGGFKVNFNLDDADLPELVKAISQITGRRFIYGGKLRQIKATVYSPEPVTANEAYSAFLSILETNGMTVIPHGRFLKIVETPGVVTQTTPVIGTAAPVPAEDRFVTRLYRIANVDPTEVANVLTKFKSKDGDVTVYPNGNLLIMTDTGSNVQRMLRLIEDIDVGGAGDQIWVEPVHYAGAPEVATKLNEILDLKGAGKGGKGGGGARITPDERTNSLVITATQPDYMRLLKLIERMDVPQSGEGQIHVLPLQHAGCKDLSATLQQILGGSGGTAAPRGRAAQAPPVPGSTDDIFEGQIKVTCDEASNKLVVTSSARDYAQLRGVIDELDMPRRQVFIEAVIMDLNVDRTLDLGIGYHGGTQTGTPGTTIYGGNNLLQSMVAPARLEALAFGVRGPEITGTDGLIPGLPAGISIPSFGIVLHAVATDSDSNVLATPHILATDNVPAEISVGANVPLQTNVGGLGQIGQLAGQAAGGAGGLGALGGLLGGVGGFQAQRENVGTKIKVTPHLNDSDQVRLELSEEISEVGSTPQGTLGAVSINKRTANTTLIVRDQQTVVIGGLVKDSVVNRETKIPILGDIPILGALFRQSIKTTQKSNLLLVLTPYVIRDQDDLRAIFERKMQERQEFLDRYFIFNDEHAWEPPRDFSRANGLVEDIRQSMMELDEKIRLEEEARPKGPRVHTPGEPIAMPSIGGGGRAGGRAAADGDNGPAPPALIPPPPATQPGGIRPRPRATPVPAPVRSMERIE